MNVNLKVWHLHSLLLVSTKLRASISRFAIGALSDEVASGPSQTMRPHQKARAAIRCNAIGCGSSLAFGLIASMGAQHGYAAGEKVPGGVFFRTSPLAPDESIEKFEGYVIAEVSISRGTHVVRTDENGGKLYEMEIWLIKAPDYILDTPNAKTQHKGFYKVFIDDLKPFVVIERRGRRAIRDEEFDFAEILYCLIHKTDEGKLQLYRKRFLIHDRF